MGVEGKQSGDARLDEMAQIQLMWWVWGDKRYKIVAKSKLPHPPEKGYWNEVVKIHFLWAKKGVQMPRPKHYKKFS